MPASSIVDKGFFTRAQGSVVDPICCQRCRGRSGPGQPRDGRVSNARRFGARAAHVPGLRLHSLPDGNIPAYLEADSIDGDPDSDLTLTGNAQVRRIDGVIKGDRINYRKDSGEVDVEGSARMMRDGTLVTGPRAKFNVDKYTGEIEKPNFWMGATGGFAVAEHADIFSKSQMRLHTVTYSGCNCEKPSWYIKATTVDVDFDENEGVARNGVLYFRTCRSWPRPT